MTPIRSAQVQAVLAERPGPSLNGGPEHLIQKIGEIAPLLPFGPGMPGRPQCMTTIPDLVAFQNKRHRQVVADPGVGRPLLFLTKTIEPHHFRPAVRGLTTFRRYFRLRVCGRDAGLRAWGRDARLRVCGPPG